MKVREIDSHAFYFPKHNEDISDLMAVHCVGHCLEPEIYDSDYLILDRKLKPRPGDYVCFKSIVCQFLLDKAGKALLKNGHSTIKPPDDSYDGVVIQINRKLGGKTQ